MNRVIGGSPESGSTRQRASQTAPIFVAAPSEIERVTGRSPIASRNALIHSQSTTGSPFVMKYARPPRPWNPPCPASGTMSSNG
jgi:hypothetical protein